MRILYISQYFPPEAGATQSRAYEMAKNWVKLGHKVTMITEFPNHPSGILLPADRGKLFERSELDGIEVLRVWVKTSPVKNFRTRLLFYLSFMISACIAGIIFLRGKFDFIYASSPPLFVGGAAIFLRVIKRLPMVFEVRDLWPDVAIALGELKNPAGITLARKLEGLCYQNAIQVVTVTQGLYNQLVDKGIQREKLIIVTNGSNTDLYKYNRDKRELVRKELGSTNKFVLLYAGIFGLAYDFTNIFETAYRLRDRNDIQFILIGDGPKKSDIKTLFESYKLPNITLLPEKPIEEMPNYLSAADVAIIPLRNLEILNVALPVKIFDAWACERPVILCNLGEASLLVNTAKGGLVIPPENPEKFVEAILFLKNSPRTMQSMGENGLIYTNQYFSRAILAQRLISHLEKLLTMQ